MNRRLYILIAVLAVLAGAYFLFSSSRSEDKVLHSRVSRRYMVCSKCGAEYDIPADYLANLNPEDVDYTETSLLVRCEQCGEIAATPYFATEIGGKKVVDSGESPSPKE